MSFKIEKIHCRYRSDALAHGSHYLNDSYEGIGSGLYASVFSIPNSDMVLKVINGNDKGYMSYLKVIQGLGNDTLAYMPKIHRVIEISYDEVDDGHYHEGPNVAYQLIWLEKLNQPKKFRYDGWDVCEWAPHRLDPTVTRFVRKLKDIMGKIKEGGPLPRLRQKHWDMIAMLELVKETHRHDYLDLHSGNVMARGKQFVITDPAS